MKINIVRSDNGDWMGIYLNGKMLAQNHSFDASETLHLLKIPHEYDELDIETDHSGSFPVDLADLNLYPLEPLPPCFLALPA